MPRRKAAREKNLTDRYLAGDLEEDRMPAQQRFTDKSKNLQQNKIVRTAQLRADQESAVDVETLPIGQVVQVFSLYSQIEHAGHSYRCVNRKTMNKLAETQMVVGDFVRFQITEDEEGVIEQVLPRKTVVVRAESFKGHRQQPLVANADQMLIVASVREPRIKWGLIDRIVIAALSGELPVVICLNKSDLVNADDEDARAADEILDYYHKTLGIRSLHTSATANQNMDALRDMLRGRTTLLAGHSGVGKSSLASAIEPGLDLRVAPLSNYTGKGRHTTTSARLYHLSIGGTLIDTPGVRSFGLWNMTPERLGEFYPDVLEGTAPDWRMQSYQRILESL